MILGNRPATPPEPTPERVAFDRTERVVQLVEQAVETNHNQLTQMGKNISGAHGHNKTTYRLCEHHDCQLASLLRLQWIQEKRNGIIPPK